MCSRLRPILLIPRTRGNRTHTHTRARVGTHAHAHIIGPTTHIDPVLSDIYIRPYFNRPVYTRYAIHNNNKCRY